MQDARQRIDTLMRAIDSERWDEALPALEAASAAFAADPHVENRLRFRLGFAWGLAADGDAAGRATLGRLRDEQARRVLDGEEHDITGLAGSPCPFGPLVLMNKSLGEERATRDLFVRLLAERPQVAAEFGYYALPALVEAGDFALAEPYVPDPMGDLEIVNDQATRMPLWPEAGGVPHVAMMLDVLLRGLRMHTRVLEGLNGGAEAQRLVETVLAGLATDALRTLAVHEWTQPGVIRQEVEQRQLAHLKSRADARGTAPV